MFAVSGSGTGTIRTEAQVGHYGQAFFAVSGVGVNCCSESAAPNLSSGAALKVEKQEPVVPGVERGAVLGERSIATCHRYQSRNRSGLRVGGSLSQDTVVLGQRFAVTLHR